MATKAKPKSKPAAPKPAASKTVPTPAVAPAKPSASTGFHLTPPKESTFWFSVVLAVIGLFAYLLEIAKLSALAWLFPFAFPLMAIAFIILVVGLLVKGF